MSTTYQHRVALYKKGEPTVVRDISIRLGREGTVSSVRAEALEVSLAWKINGDFDRYKLLN